MKRLEASGLVALERRRGVLRVTLSRAPPTVTGVLRVGILRAAEYPYVLRLRRLLLDRFSTVRILVYDDPVALQAELARGFIHVAMLPVVTALLAYRITGGRIRIVAGGSGGGAALIANPSSESPAHATTRMSSMELCAEKLGLDGPRLYMDSGRGIVEAVRSGQASRGLVWYPYAEIARRSGLRVEPCELETCCVMTANSALENYYPALRRAMEESVAWARRNARSMLLARSLASLIGEPAELVSASLPMYEYYEEPPLSALMSSLEYIRTTLLPVHAVRDAVYP